MISNKQLAFELEIIKLFNLSKHLIWCDIHFGAGEVPTVKCEYEVWIDGNPKIVDDQIKKIKKKLKILIDERAEN